MTAPSTVDTRTTAAADAAGTRYVSASGSDRNPGTITRPWKTIQKAVNVAKPGDTILVRAGTYPSWVEWERSGTASKKITLTAYPGERPVIAGRLKISADNVVVRGLTLTGPTEGSYEPELYLSNASNVMITRNEIRNTKMSAILVAGGSGITITRNWIHDVGSTWSQDHGVYWSDGSGVLASNVIEATIGYGIHLYANADGVRVVQNTVSDNSLSGILVAGSDEATSDRNVIANNIVVDNTEWGIRTYWGGSVGIDNIAVNNLAFGNGDGAISGDDGLAVSGTIEADPRFVDFEQRDYHIRAGSPALSQASTEYVADRDFDGRRRPLGAGPDIGAFER